MIYNDILGLVQKAIQLQLITEADRIYALNQTLFLLQLDRLPDEHIQPSDHSIPHLVESITEEAVNRGVIEQVLDEKEVFAGRLMDIFTDKPSVVRAAFVQKYAQSPRQATDYFYQFSKNSNYIQTQRLKQNIEFKAATPYGEMDITINLSKPEKDPEQIKRERLLQTKNGYPKCLLCKENEGYAGRIGHPARSNHRIIPISLKDEQWFFQYSPYLYYQEHSILLSGEHRDMKIDRNTFLRLLRFVEQFPHYFIGSNADLPIVGGSILSHDHYQAGNYQFAMTDAKSTYTFNITSYPNVDAAILHWPLSVIRMKAENIDELVACAEFILNEWKTYSDPAIHIYAKTNGIPHNTITPISRYRDGKYELDLVLRNNRTTDEFPYGIFHPHEDVHHIKKENIGLIEVMGLAVLPPRLKDELEKIRLYLLDETTSIDPHHVEWAHELKTKYGEISSKEQVSMILQTELGSRFVRILEDAGVFKDLISFKKFLTVLKA
ncbi:UDP-glucose--hexose-1-phosphate uridylyltransferase [Alkalihalobacillus pseudalcaliphilus]|uniref:UDP-glucose--hexose-1-phosphate uridylyltransferase n=1 Tax=Alkalihalobacillus pseudalcaliphilus TaxID=79884 RepID=UPI00064D78FC|nr:UDP-glucose--hexose-1-phosphate uridylyltransferase [Alkalihalobacillus pseudalcaliphilus]KMK74671.1 galactose-1-phosphate uridylyltransferase [Alkalihalobacillus pseudalcaliphilus]